jgi:hypothetical protein
MRYESCSEHQREVSMIEWDDCYHRHFTKFFTCNPIERRLFTTHVDRERSIEIFTYDDLFDGCRAFTTIGLSQFSQELGHISEIYSASDEGWSRVPYILANTLFHMIDDKMEIGWGIVMRGVEIIAQDFYSQYGKSAVYISLPIGLPDEFRRVTCGDRTGHVYLATLITAAEADYFSKHGADALEERFEEAEVDPFCLTRPSVV